jgi:membrane-associated phospholipid phosphatase
MRARVHPGHTGAVSGDARPRGFLDPVLASAAVTAIGMLSTPLLLGADRAIALAADAHLSPGWRATFKAITSLGNATPYVLLALLALAALALAARLGRASPQRVERLRQWGRYPHPLLASLAVSGLLVSVAKPLVGRLRPRLLVSEGLYGFEPLQLDFAANSFPSGHAQTVWVVASVLLLLAARLRADLKAVPPAARPGTRVLLGALCLTVLVAATLVALSRVLLNAHFLSDVLAGSLLGVHTTLWLAPRVLAPGRARPTPETCPTSAGGASPARQRP